MKGVGPQRERALAARGPAHRRRPARPAAVPVRGSNGLPAGGRRCTKGRRRRSRASCSTAAFAGPAAAASRSSRRRFATSRAACSPSGPTRRSGRTRCAPHQRVILHGPVTRFRGVLQMNSPDVEIVDEAEAEPLHTRRIVPVYERIGPVTSRMQRTMVHGAARGDAGRRGRPAAARRFASVSGFPDRRRALAEAHFPPAGHRRRPGWPRFDRPPSCA